MALNKKNSNAPEGTKVKAKIKTKKPKTAKAKFSIFGHNLLLKQTVLSTWKSKLQLVILLLLSSFATALITGTYISYQRIVDGANYMGLNDAQFDAVLPSPKPGMPINEIANQAFSLHTGRLYYQSGTGAPVARYYDDTILGQQTLPLQASDLNISYQRDSSNTITGIASFDWANNNPITFNLDDQYVKASIYGQLKIKANNSSGVLRQHYEAAAQQMYDRLFMQVTAPQLKNSLNNYISTWISTFSGARDPKGYLKLSDTAFTTWILNNKINYRGGDDTSSDPKDLRIPFSVNLGDAAQATDVLNKYLVQSGDPNPRVSYDENTDYGLNGQWMQIFRNFAMTPTPSDATIRDFLNNYNSPSNYNMVTDNVGGEDVFSTTYALGAAALQNRDMQMINQFTGTAFVKNVDGKSVDFEVRVIDLGLQSQYNRPNLKIFEGVYPTSLNELVISPQYARINGIKPGDNININNRQFIVSGIGGDAFNIYPTFSPTDPVPNTRSQFLIYVYPDAFNDSNWYQSRDVTDTSLMYFLPWQNAPPASGFDTSQFDDFYQKNMFTTNGLNDLLQYDYSNYLINKYVNHTPFTSKYNITHNLVAVKGSSEFIVYNQGMTSYNAILSGFKWAGFGGVLFIIMIVCFMTYLIVKKAIQKAQVSTGILKSSGYSTLRVVTSYLAYPLIALIIAIPIGWFAGLALQIYFTEIFNTLFVLPYNVFSFNPIPALISIAVIIGFIVLTSLLTAYKMLQKPPLLLIKKDSDIAVGNKHKIGWLQAKIKHNFRFKFLLSLTKTSWKKIFITGSVISLATLAITATVSIPATLSNMRTTYFKSQKYQNYYEYQQPIPNMPLSKFGLYAWNNLENPNDELYYPVAGAMPWADNIIINDPSNNTPLAYYNPLEYQITKYDDIDPTKPTENNFADIVKFYPAATAQQQTDIKTQVGANLLAQGANGPLNTGLITWNYSWLGGRAFSNQLILDLAKQDKSPGQGYSSALIDLAANLLPGITGLPNPGGISGKDAISEILKQTLPGYIRQILDQKARDNPDVDPYKFFSIGHNTISYDPTYSKALNGPSEELVTQFKIGSDNPSLVNKGFLDVVGINPNTDMLTINQNLVNQLKYSSSQSIIPMVVNRAFASQYGLSVGDQFNAAPDVNTLFYKDTNNNYKPIPKSDWYYGPDPDNPTPNSMNDVWNRSANKWNARGSIPIGSGASATQFSDSFGYNYNGVYDKNGQPVTTQQPQEWNDTNQLWLKLPSDINSVATTNGQIKKHGGGVYNFSNLDNISSTSKEWIRPFDFHLALPAGTTIDPTNLLTQNFAEWYGGMLDQGILKTAPTLEGKDGIQKAIQNVMPDWWEGMTGSKNPVHQYKIIGIQDSYDTARAFVDQKWANSILGYSYVNDRGDDKDPTYGPGIYQWFSGKMSSFEDIYDVVARLSISYSSADYSLYGVNDIKNNYQQSMIQNADLLSRKKQMFDKMTGIAFSASAIFIITTILCSVLIVIMITDLFTDQFRRFMALMKSEGYRNREINSFTLGIFTPWVIMGYVIGFGLGILTVFACIKILQVVMHIVLPLAFIWWLIPFSLFIIGGIYITTFLINNRQLNKMNLIDLLKTNE